MYERLEQLRQIKEMCLYELKQVKENCERYSSNMTLLTEKLNSHWEDSTYLKEYDSFLTNITSILDTTRKFNIQINLNCMQLSEIQKVFSMGNYTKGSQIATENNGTLREAKRNFFPAEEYDLSTEAFDDFVYPTLNLSDIYKPGQTIYGIVTYVKDLKFYILDNSNQYGEDVVELSKSLELRQYHGFPAPSEVFGCVLDNQIFRAVLGSKTLYDDELNEKICLCYLLDTGEIMPLKSDHIMYRLTNDQKKIPALALPCKLITKNKNPFKNTTKDKLKEIEYKKCNFKIKAIENNILHLELVDKPHIAENNTIDMVTNKTGQLQLTEEELDMLYEEPLGTSNAMKAVMGYDPQDDKRICRFYNSSTGGCFKGINCKLEHTLRQPDGWTKDVMPASSIIDSQQPIAVFTPDSIINITPTYIGKLDRFFAQINDPNKTCAPLVWNDEDVPSWKVLQKAPLMFELVLCRYVDDLWYRAKIMSHDDDYMIFEVFYVDYGNIQKVHLRNLASIDPSMARLPFQAVLCRFENVNEKPTISVEERKNCIEILCEMILNKSMDVKVVSHYEDLFISFVDRNSYPLPEVLIEMGFLEFNKNKILF